MSKHSLPGPAPVLHAATSPYRSGPVRAVLAVFFSLVLFVVSTGWFVYHDLTSTVKNNAIDISGLGSQSGQSGDKEADPLPADQFEGNALNILVVGVDSREGSGNSEYGSTSQVEGMRGDTTMLMHISADRSRVQIVSIPRDLMTQIPSCTRTDGTVSPAQYGQFNSALTIGANDGYDVASGIACTKATVEELTGLDVNAFMVVDFSGFKKMIDALGGVWFNLDEAVSDEKAELDLPAGCQKLNGTQALAYARARYNLGDGSDISRIGRQQQLVAAIMREALSKNYVTDLPALLSFVKQALSAVSTSTNLANLDSDAGLLLSLTNIDKANIQFVTMPFQYSTVYPNRVVEDETLAPALWKALSEGSPLPVGITYTDGTGAEKTVAEPTTAQSGADTAQSTATPQDTTTPAPTPSVSQTHTTCPPGN